jgi:adenosylmethionine-8-amino-7-oxononanoate aminotransferase
MQLAQPPIAILKGEGAYLYDENGQQYFDAISSWWVNIHGHAHPHIAQAVAAQVKELEQVIFAGFTHPKAVILAEELLKVLPNNQQRIFYSDNGSTAVEVALKMAFQYWHNKEIQKTKIIAFSNSYHGDTFGAMSVSGRSAFTAPFLPYLFDVITVDAPLPGHEEQAIAALKTAIGKDDNIAAFIYEPLIQGAVGMLMYEPQWLDKMMTICKENSILTIADEVMTGFGRTGKWFASSHLQQQPDIMCLSKGITGGTMALGVTTCTKQVYDAFLSNDKLKTLFHGHSFTANSIACAAAVASLELMHEDSTWANINRIEKHHKAFVNKLKENPQLKDIRQCGTILALELETGETTSYFSNRRDYIYQYFIDRGIIMRPLGNVIYLLPPYCSSNEDLDSAYAAVESLLMESAAV